MRRVVSTALLLATLAASTPFVASNVYTFTFDQRWPEETSLIDVPYMREPPCVAYCVPFVDMWWNIRALFRSKTVPLFTAQRYRDRLSARHLALAPALTGVGAARLLGIFSDISNAVGGFHTLKGMCKGAAQHL